MKSKKLIIPVALFALVALGAYLVYAATILVTVPVVSCSESDSGVNYLSAGSIFAVLNLTNSTQVYNSTDYCLTNTTVGEFVCGGSIDPSLATLAGLVAEDCSLVPINGTTNATICFQGRCI